MANSAGYKPNEGKREEFRRYLEKTGVMDALTKVLVLLYEETDKPDDALKFILNSLARQMGSETIDDLKAQIVELQSHVSQLETDHNASNTVAGHLSQDDEIGEQLPESNQSTDGAEEAQEKQLAEPVPVEESAA